MIRTALLTLTIVVTTAAGAHAAQTKTEATPAEKVQACHPIFVTCPQEPGVLRGMALLDKHLAPAALREEAETAFA